MGKENKHKSSKDSGDSGPGWEIVYSGFILIMLCFFVMLSSFATMEEAKIMRFVRSFASAVSIFPGGKKFESSTVVLPESSAIVSQDESALAKILHELDSLVGASGFGEEVRFSFSPEGLVLRLSDYALFDLGVAELSPAALPLMEKIGAVIANTSYLVRIEGHTDNLPIHTERFPSNWELSTTRAVNVLRYFRKNHEIPAHRLAAAGFAEYRPLVPNDSAAQRAQNRRVEIIFIK
jgi:chemotaxis protein MotB